MTGSTMTLRVYAVDRYGNTRVLRPEAEVVPAATVDRTAAYPPCRCEQCRRCEPTAP